jgi:hypothetical protein
VTAFDAGAFAGSAFDALATRQVQLSATLGAAAVQAQATLAPTVTPPLRFGALTASAGAAVLVRAVLASLLVPASASASAARRVGAASNISLGALGMHAAGHTPNSARLKVAMGGPALSILAAQPVAATVAGRLGALRTPSGVIANLDGVRNVLRRPAIDRVMRK